MGLTDSNFKVQPYSTRTTLSQSMNFGSGGLRSNSGLSINEKPKENAEIVFNKRLEFLKTSIEDYDPAKTAFLQSEKA